jgi:hypothetical protein
MRIDVWDLAIDDRNREHMHANGISVAVALEVVDGEPRVIPNHVANGAQYLLVGPTSRGMVTLPIDSTPEDGVWRPRTGYPSKDSDIARYAKMGKSK